MSTQSAPSAAELQRLFEELLARFPDYVVDEGKIVRNQLVPTRGVGQAPVSL